MRSTDFLRYRKAFEDSVGETLALDLTKNDRLYYTSPKTANLFIAFCYGWVKGEGDTRSMAAFRADLAHAMAPQQTPTETPTETL